MTTKTNYSESKTKNNTPYIYKDELAKVSGMLFKDAEETSKGKTKLVIISNGEFVSVFLPNKQAFKKGTSIECIGSVSENEHEGKMYFSLFLNTGKPGHSLKVLSFSDEMLK